MKIRLGLLALPNSLKKGVVVFVLLGTLVLVNITLCPAARIAFASGKVGDSDIYVMTTGGKNVQQLTHHKHDDWGTDLVPG